MPKTLAFMHAQHLIILFNFIFGVSKVEKSCETRKFQCNICHKNYPRNYELLRHIRFVHEKKKNPNLQCSQCEYNCSEQIEMEDRMHFIEVMPLRFSDQNN